MATTRRHMRDVTPTQVFDVLRDGRSYGHWVVGTRTTREVDPQWPMEGAALEAHAWPAGTAGIVSLESLARDR